MLKEIKYIKFAYKNGEKIASQLFPTSKQNLEHYAHKPWKKRSFSKLFSDFRFWTFINVQISFPFLLLALFLFLLGEKEKNIYSSFCNQIWYEN